MRFSPYAWAKLLYLRDAGQSEIGGFGISAADDPLFIKDVRLVRQRCDWASVAFDDGAVADFFDEQVELGRKPAEFARVWVHTHPGDSPAPSATDEETFSRAFGACDWAVMFILAQGGKCYTRLGFTSGPGGNILLPAEVDYAAEFFGSDQDAWHAEYDACVESAAVAAQEARWLQASSSAVVLEDQFEWLDDYRLAEFPLGEEAGYGDMW